ncbi:MAG: hypothetical protein JW807_12160 [Spirochaetes bacterium]|nr:hypothetical protein [Spirochaetota bacterium]
MEETTIELLLGDGCCIECAAKRTYNAMVLHLMTAEEAPAPDVEGRLDLLLEFLETSDFSRLRGSDEALDGTSNSRCLLRRDDDGKPLLTVIETGT